MKQNTVVMYNELNESKMSKMLYNFHPEKSHFRVSNIIRCLTPLFCCPLKDPNARSLEPGIYSQCAWINQERLFPNTRNSDPSS